MGKEAASKKTGAAHIILSVLGIILCVIFGFLLICNLTIIIKGTVNPDRPPSVFGSTPMVVLSGSMSGSAEDHIEVGDLIIIGKADIDALEKGDVISFMEKDSTSVVTHRIIDITTDEEGKRLFTTKGDANISEDKDGPVPADRVIGIYKFRIPKVGNFALFLQKPLGMVIFIGIPVCAFIIYDIARRQRRSAKDEKNTEKMQAEIDRLRAEAGSENQESAEVPEQAPADDKKTDTETVTDTETAADTKETDGDSEPVKDEDAEDRQ